MGQRSKRKTPAGQRGAGTQQQDSDSKHTPYPGGKFHTQSFARTTWNTISRLVDNSLPTSDHHCDSCCSPSTLFGAVPCAHYETRKFTSLTRLLDSRVSLQRPNSDWTRATGNRGGPGYDKSNQCVPRDTKNTRIQLSRRLSQQRGYWPTPVPFPTSL